MNQKLMVLLSLFAIIILASCSKNDDPNSENSTNSKTTAVFNPSLTYGTMTDQDGNVYKTITIGTQTWMAENLRTSKYNDGIAIPLVNSDTAWENLSTGAYCNYNNITKGDTIDTYGRLYNWDSVNTGKLAPKGWHVPTDTEWTTLITYLGGESIAGAKLKEAGITHWKSPNTNATNESGFTALPGGSRSLNGPFDDSEYYFGGYGWWWSATDNKYLCLSYDYIGTSFNGCNKKYGFSVRCVKD